MPAIRIIPDAGTLRHWVEDEKLSHKEIAARVYEQTGHHVARSTISAALSRAGLTKEQLRYHDEIPWVVRDEHLREYPVRLLRLLGRRRAGLSLNHEEDKRLSNWLAMLEKENAVVAYDPDSEEGFVYTDRIGTDPADLPIRPQYVKID